MESPGKAERRVLLVPKVIPDLPVPLGWVASLVVVDSLVVPENQDHEERLVPLDLPVLLAPKVAMDLLALLVLLGYLELQV